MGDDYLDNLSSAVRNRPSTPPPICSRGAAFKRGSDFGPVVVQIVWIIAPADFADLWKSTDAVCMLVLAVVVSIASDLVSLQTIVTIMDRTEQSNVDNVGGQ
jgi:hypothetical protein